MSSTTNAGNAKSRVKLNTETGGLRRLPVVKPHKEIIATARRQAYRESDPDKTIKNAKLRARKQATIKLDALTKALSKPLREAVDGYRRELRRLHPFEKVVADLTARARQKKDGLTLTDVLDDIHESRKEMLITGKDWVAKAKSAESARDAMQIMEEGEAALCETFSALAGDAVDGLLELQKSLRTTPAVRLDTPAVVLVGSPNVGKSSIVRTISSATPEVNNYPFTTRGMTLGHVEVFWKDEVGGVAEVNFDAENNSERRSTSASYAYSQLCQVMDSPGLLVRADNDRNEMEALTLAAMQHLPTAVMYVMDLSGLAGDACSSVEDQLQLRKEMRARFPRRPWIDVVSKCDLGVVDDAREKLIEILDGDDYIELSIHEGIGVEELRKKVVNMLAEVRIVLDAMASAN
eukprot:CAMPEP_0116021940 /NCGR_PEP_ID=MMETSP0321-20121206/10689_1 /TAXON_ID=163516 /ORGANISM="Leptocylindrus danicus var. danicus, Strain B650" /LENGTH=406 /DNA_ID=CAMNT_0003492913 /DNA_START=236 /DNA_END=1456 /DNA_ORIENTATION=-